MLGLANRKKTRMPILRMRPVTGISVYMSTFEMESERNYFLLLDLICSCPVILQYNTVTQEHSQMIFAWKQIIHQHLPYLFFPLTWEHLTSMSTPDSPTLHSCRRQIISDTTALPKDRWNGSSNQINCWIVLYIVSIPKIESSLFSHQKHTNFLSLLIKMPLDVIIGTVKG